MELKWKKAKILYLESEIELELGLGTERIFGVQLQIIDRFGIELLRLIVAPSTPHAAFLIRIRMRPYRHFNGSSDWQNEYVAVMFLCSIGGWIGREEGEVHVDRGGEGREGGVGQEEEVGNLGWEGMGAEKGKCPKKEIRE